MAQERRDLVGIEVRRLQQGGEVADPCSFMISGPASGRSGRLLGQVFEGSSRLGHQGHAYYYFLALRNDVVVGLLGELAADRGLKGREVAVCLEACKKGHFLREESVPDAFQEAGGGFLVVYIPLFFVHPDLDGCMHAAVEIGEHEEAAAKGFADLAAGGDGVGEDDPYEGD